MFSIEEKRKIAEELEKLLLSFNHPEIPKEKPDFRLYVDGKAGCYWDSIEPNWKIT